MAEETPEVQPEDGATPESDEQLGENGLKALKAEREAAAAEKKRADELAQRIQEIEDRDKSEEQKRQEERDRLTKEVADLKAAKSRAEVAAATSVPPEILAGPESSDPGHLKAYADALVAWRGEQPNQRLHIPNEGNSPAKQPSSEAEFAKELFARGD
jgi:hypothetical protein